MKKLIFSTVICFLFGGALRAQCVSNCTLYSISAIAANPSPTTGATALVLGDDVISAAVPIGFTFTYMCTAYTQAYVGSNGFISFNPAVGAGCCSGQIDPTVGGNPNNYVALAWNDLYPPGAGTINYMTIGVAPNRIFVVTYSLIPFCCGAGPPNVSGQIKLYETTNVIEVHNFNVGNNGNNQTQGIMDATGNTGVAAPGRNSVPWTAIDDGYRFTPTAMPPPCAGTPTAGTAVASPTQFCGTFTSNLSLTGNVPGCGLAWQWQRAIAPGGPWVNVPGATSPTANVTSTVTNYYRCVITCTNGGATATSVPATCSVTPVGPCALCTINNVVSLPYNSGAQTTCGNGNNVTAPGNVTNICGTSFYYGGEDAVYSFTPAATGAITLGVASPGTDIGLMLYQGCPVSGGLCVGQAQSFCCTWTLCVNVTAGVTYYVVIDSWPAPTCNPYTLSISAPGPCVGSIAGITAFGSPTFACGTLTTNLSLSAVSACGPTYQWQVSLSVGGPYTNVPSGNFAAITATTNVSNFYRCLLTCGGTTAVSTVVQTSVAAFTPPPCSLSSYVAASCTYSWDNFVGTACPTGDDNLYNGFGTFGFPFCFSGQQFSGGYIGSNNEFVFDGIPCFPNLWPMPGGIYAAPGQSTGWSISLAAPTNADYTPRNAILCPWEDLYPPAGGLIQYTTIGVTPNRRFVVSWDNVSMFSCTSTSCSTQLKLYETSNNIEIHVRAKNLCPSWNAGQAIMGLHNYDGSIYIPPVNMVAHNAPTQWTMTNTAYRFTSSCPSQSICGVVLPIGFKSFSGQQINGINKLFWETSEEENIKDFIVERSLDGVAFTSINLTGSTGKPTAHSYDDNTFERGYINYYKITAVDISGNKTSTSIYAVFNTDDKVLISSIYPNPATEKLTINITGRGANADCSFIIYDQFGRIVVKKDQSVAMGANLVNVDIASLERGIYIIEINAGQGTVISKQKFSKQ